MSRLNAKHCHSACKAPFPLPHTIISTSSCVLTANAANQAEKPNDYWFLSNRGSKRISHYQTDMGVEVTSKSAWEFIPLSISFEYLKIRLKTVKRYSATPLRSYITNVSSLRSLYMTEVTFFRLDTANIVSSIESHDVHLNSCPWDRKNLGWWFIWDVLWKHTLLCS